MSDNTNSGGSDLISQQILQDAGFYPPTIYDLLTRYGSLVTKPCCTMAPSEAAKRAADPSYDVSTCFASTQPRLTR